MIIDIKDLPPGQIISRISVDITFDGESVQSNVLTEGSELHQTKPKSSNVKPIAPPPPPVPPKIRILDDSLLKDRKKMEIPPEMQDLEL